MNKKKLFGTIATVALGVSLVGAAYADTQNNPTIPETTSNVQHRVNMTQEDLEAMNKNMSNLVVIDNETNDATQNETTNTKSNQKIGSIEIIEDNQYQQDMIELHNNQEQMAKWHQEMHQTNMYEDMDNMPMYNNNTNVNNSMGSHMGSSSANMSRHMMGR